MLKEIVAGILEMTLLLVQHIHTFNSQDVWRRYLYQALIELAIELTLILPGVKFLLTPFLPLENCFFFPIPSQVIQIIHFFHDSDFLV